MRRKEKALQVARILEEIFPSPAIPLKHESPFTLLIAVLLSAQCTDVRVNLVTKNFFDKLRTPQDFLKIGQEKLEKWSTEAKNL